MAVQYDMYKVKDVHNSENDGLLRARTVPKGTISTDQLIDYVTNISGFSSGQAKGLIAAFEETILNYLADGYDVQLGNIGFLSVSVTSRLVKNKKELRSESVSFKGLNFRISSTFRRMLKYVKTERLPYNRNQSSNLSMERKAQILKEHLLNKTCATSRDYCRITDTLKGKAIQELNTFIEDGWLQKYGSGRTVVYILNKEQD